MIFKLAWRNLWRNSKRSWLTISAIGTAYVFLMVMGGWIAGLSDQILTNGTKLLIGHAQVHHKDYLPDRSVYDWIGAEQYDLDGVVSELLAFEGVKAASARVLGFGLISTGDSSYGVQLIGVEPESEGAVSTLLTSVVAGNSLQIGSRGGILLGDVLAKSLGADPGREVALVTQAVDGTIGNELYEVAGVFDSGISYLDRSLALIHREDLQELLSLEEWQVHEFVVVADDPHMTTQLTAALNSSPLLPQDSEARSWEQLLPQLREYLAMAKGMGLFLITLVGVFAGIGTLNTMMMAVFERTREIGTLNALGLGPLKILCTFLVESFFLCVLGVGAGLLVGSLLVYQMNTVGIDLSRWTGNFTIVDSSFDPILKASWVWDQFFWSAIGLSVAVLLATLIPAIRASRMDPVEAIHAPTEG